MAKAKYDIGDQVFLVSDPEQESRMIVAVLRTPNGVEYSIRIDGQLVDFYEIELSDTKNVI